VLVSRTDGYLGGKPTALVDCSETVADRSGEAGAYEDG
jgi:hypothetical protein